MRRRRKRADAGIQLAGCQASKEASENGQQQQEEEEEATESSNKEHQVRRRAPAVQLNLTKNHPIV